jgi:hypothetical protein
MQLVCSVVYLALGEKSLAEPLTITVLNEQNKGIRSRVVYKSGPAPQVLGDTNDQGALIKDFACTDGQVLSAKPFDKGSYFDSTDEPCQPKMTLRVLSRQNPKGYAVNFRVEKTTLSDGSPAVVTYKGFVSSTTAPTPGRDGCAVNINSVVEQQLFKVDGIAWKPLKSSVVESSSLFGDPIKGSVLVPFNCNAAQSRVETLNAVAADKLSKHLSVGTYSLDPTFKEFKY